MPLIALALLWLVPLARYDLRYRAVPHIACVAVPCLLATGYAALRGEWALAVIALVAVGASERHRLPTMWRGPVFLVGLLVAASLLTQVPLETFPGAGAVIGFWLCFEIGWWAGADALAAITLALLWPDMLLLAAFAVAHIGLSLMRRNPICLPRALTPPELEAVGQPGLPALAVAVMVYGIGQWVIG